MKFGQENIKCLYSTGSPWRSRVALDLNRTKTLNKQLKPAEIVSATSFRHQKKPNEVLLMNKWWQMWHSPVSSARCTGWCEIVQEHSTGWDGSWADLYSLWWSPEQVQLTLKKKKPASFNTLEMLWRHQKARKLHGSHSISIHEKSVLLFFYP